MIRPIQYGGYTIIPSQVMPETMQNIKVSLNCPCTDEGREKMNKFLLDTFGADEYLVVFGDAIFAHPNVISRIKLRLDELQNCVKHTLDRGAV